MQSYYSHFLSTCGDIENITRLLKQGERWCFEVENLNVLNNITSEHEINTQLKQVTFPAEYVLTQAEAENIGLCIENQQQSKIAAYVQETSSVWRPKWHIAPPQGLLNDPNGFVFHQGKCHLFYQWNPYTCEHKDKHWVHLVSSDLINWHNIGVSLTPSHWFDSHGVFSGHALSKESELYLFYTGNVRLGIERERMTTQCVAKSCDDGKTFTKLGPVISALPPNATPHCRDPKVIAFDDHWLMLLGVQIEKEGKRVGRLAVYSSLDLQTWEFKYIAGDELGDYGYMWECPDIFELDGETYVVIGPQGIDGFSVYHHSPHKNIYLKANLQADRLELQDPKPLDYGFDFYAPQTALSPDGRCLLVAWMGLPDEVDQPSVKDGWIHQLTGFRELNVRNGRIYQAPIREIMQLRGDECRISVTQSTIDLGSKSLCLHTKLNYMDKQELYLFANTKYALDLIIDPELNELRLDRSHTLKNDGDKVRAISLDLLKESNDLVLELQILMDNSSVEIYLNNGAQVMSARVFTPSDATGISYYNRNINNERLDISYWSLSSKKG